MYQRRRVGGGREAAGEKYPAGRIGVSGIVSINVNVGWSVLLDDVDVGIGRLYVRVGGELDLYVRCDPLAPPSIPLLFIPGF